MTRGDEQPAALPMLYQCLISISRLIKVNFFGKVYSDLHKRVEESGSVTAAGKFLRIRSYPFLETRARHGY